MELVLYIQEKMEVMEFLKLNNDKNQRKLVFVYSYLKILNKIFRVLFTLRLLVIAQQLEY